MELKVWVEGVQRVVCGITEQTTVQEVVIALAQATGRTGRYTLVEQWHDAEKMLPPTEQPLKVLSKWGNAAKDVKFLLRRTGASSVSSDTNSKGPERNVYRQSLPPPSKNRSKEEILQGIKRKEPKRKSLTNSANNKSDKEKIGIQNTNGNNNKAPLMPSNKQKSLSLDRTKQKNIRDRPPSTSNMVNVKKASENINSKLNVSSSQNEPKGGSLGGKKKAMLPPQMNTTSTRDQSNSVSSAKDALFPQASIGEIKARSPSKSSYVATKTNEPTKSAILPPSAKYNTRPRVSSSNSFDTSSNIRNPTPVISHQYSNSNDASSRRPIMENEYENVPPSSSLPKTTKKTWSATESLKGHGRSGSAGGKAALLPPANMQRQTHSASAIPERQNFHPALRDGYTPKPSHSKSPSEIKAQNEFNSLLSEQQKHISKQKDTIQALENEIDMLQVDMQTREKINESSAQAEIARLEELIENNGVEMMNQALLMQHISVEELTYDSLKNEMNELQDKLKRTNNDITKFENNLSNLSNDVQNEIAKKQQFQQRAVVTGTKNEIHMKSKNLRNLEEDVKRLEKENEYLEYDLNEKYAVMDTLNRELRQFDLQQFIRKTGSKITVLPPNTEDDFGSGNNMYQPPQEVKEPPKQSAEGVWV